MFDAPRSSSIRSAAVLILGFAFLVIGFLFEPLFIAASVGILGMAIASRPGRKTAGYGVMALAALLIVFQLGYGIGKNMARRDNAVQASVSTGAA